MARSSYIWVVLSPTSMPVGAFTVKHELESFLDRTSRDVRLFRIRDGQTQQQPWMKYNLIEQLDPKTLKPIEG